MPTILELSREIPTKAVQAGTVLFAEGKRSGALCILISGEIEILKGEFQLNTVSEAGAFFGEMSLLLNAPHTATVRTLTQCQVHWIDDGDVFLRNNKEIAYDFLRVLAGRLRDVTSHLTDLNRYVRSV